MKNENQTQEESSDEPKTSESKGQRSIREAKENPIVSEKIRQITIAPDIQSRENAIKNIRQKINAEKNISVKDTPQQKSNTNEEIETVIENVNNHAKGVVSSVHDFVGGEGRSEQLSRMRQRKNQKSKGLER